MKHIVVADDCVANLESIEKLLKENYKVTLLTSCAQTLNFLANNKPDLVLIDVGMHEEKCFEMLEMLKSDGASANIPVILITNNYNIDIETKALSHGAVDFITRPFVAMSMLSRIKIHLEVADYRRGLEKIIMEKTQMVEKLQDAVVISLAELVECRDGETGGHVKRAGVYLEILATALLKNGDFPDLLDQQYIYDMKRSAALHDIGKVGIADATLLKPSRLDAKEMEYMRQHTTLGGTALQKAIDETECKSFLYVAKDMALSHHEKWNGSGYPHGLRGEEIPLCAQIMAIADVYDALTSKRSYKEAISHKAACDIIISGRGVDYQSSIVDAFSSVVDDFEVAMNNFRVTH